MNIKHNLLEYLQLFHPIANKPIANDMSWTHADLRDSKDSSFTATQYIFESSIQSLDNLHGNKGMVELIASSPLPNEQGTAISHQRLLARNRSSTQMIEVMDEYFNGILRKIKVKYEITLAEYGNEEGQDSNEIFPSEKLESESRYLKLLKFNTILTLEELQSLGPGIYVDGKVIDCFMILMFNQRWKNAYFFPTTQTNFMIGERCNDEHSADWSMYHIDFIFKGKVFLPYCLGKHWLTVELDIEKGTITHYDPLHLNNGKRAISAFFKYLKNCSPTARNNLPKIDWKITSIDISIPIQVDSYNCALFVMYYMNCSEENKNSPDFAPDDYRSEIIRLLLSHNSQKESTKNLCLYCFNSKEKLGDVTPCTKCDRWDHKKCVVRCLTKLASGSCELH